MTTSTSFAQVANNLLNVLQGCSKTIRLLLVMFLTLTASTAWGADYTLVTSNTNLKNGDKVIIATKNSSGKPNTGVTGQNGNNDATVSTTESNWVQYVVGSASTSGWTLYDSGQDKYIAQPTGNHFKYNTTAGTCFVNSNGVLGCNSRYLQANGTYYRMYSSINNSYTPFYVWKVSASYTITAQSNNTNYGTVSLNGTTITASPKTGYCVSTTTPYTISPSNSAKVTQSENKFTITPTANCTITINFAALPKYAVTLKDDNSTLTQSTAGGSVDLPSRDGCDGYTFVGWTKTWTEEKDEWTTTAPTIISAGSYTPTANVNLYPVYTKTATTPGTTTTTTDYVLTDLANIKSTDVVVITSKNSSGSYYAMSNSNGTGSAPTATSVSVSSTKLSSAPNDNLKWNISNNSGTLTIYPNGTTSTWLYCTSTNNGVRVGTNTNKTFTIDSSTGYLKHIGTSRYLGVYNNQDWRCYTSTSTNIGSQTLAFFVETTTTTTTSTTTTSYISTPDCGSTEPTYSVTWNPNGGNWSGNTNYQVDSYEEGESISKPADPTRDGYTFNS